MEGISPIHGVGYPYWAATHGYGCVPIGLPQPWPGYASPSAPPVGMHMIRHRLLKELRLLLWVSRTPDFLVMTILWVAAILYEAHLLAYIFTFSFYLAFIFRLFSYILCFISGISMSGPLHRQDFLRGEISCKYYIRLH